MTARDLADVFAIAAFLAVAFAALSLAPEWDAAVMMWRAGA